MRFQASFDGILVLEFVEEEIGRLASALLSGTYGGQALVQRQASVLAAVGA